MRQLGFGYGDEDIGEGNGEVSEAAVGSTRLS